MKKTIATMAIMVVMATVANAGIIVGGRSAGQCSTQGTGIIVGGRTGIIVGDRTGIVSVIADIITSMTTSTNGCSSTERTGIIVGG